MRKAIFHAVVRDRQSRGFNVIEVTTEKGRQVYGRHADGASTHVASRDVLARLPDQGTADRFLIEAERIDVKHRRPIAAARGALTAAERARQVELDELVAKHRDLMP